MSQWFCKPDVTEQAALVNWDLERRAMIVRKVVARTGVRETTCTYA